MQPSDQEADDLAAKISDRLRAQNEDAEVMQWALEVVYRMRMALTRQAEELRLSKEIIEKLLAERPGE